MRRPVVLVVVLFAGVGVGACADDDAPAISGVDRTGDRLTRRAPAPSAAGALAEIADGAQARRRVGYVNVGALEALTSGTDAQVIARRVLGRGARHLGRVPADGVRTLVQVGSVSVLSGPGLSAGREVRGNGMLARLLADPRPERSAIQPVSPSAVQSCLGDAAAQTIVGSAALGPSTTIGAGLRSGQDVPSGLKLVICVSPRYRKQLYGFIRAAERRFGRPDATDPRAPVIGEDEIGEQQIARAIIPAERVSRADLLAYMQAGRKLRSLLPLAP